MEKVAVVLKIGLVLMAIFCALPSVCKAFSQSSSGEVTFVNFDVDEFSYLNITKLGSELVEYREECGFACLEIPSCLSYNLAAFSDINGQSLCELLPSDKHNNSDKFAPNRSFHHYSIPSPCSSWPCKNNGKCVTLYDKVKSYTCVCKEGFTGKNCETNINECDSNPCVNNGNCNDRINGFNCSCPPGFNGSRCEKDINECASNPCKNNGTCNDGVNEFNCSCPPGFAGDLCETDIDECDSNPCVNNGTCIDGVNGFTCNCTREFGGDRCEIDLSINSAILATFLVPAVGNDPKWVLCYHASIHGWAASTFHSRCDGKRDTVTIIRNGPCVFGGYTDLPWDGSSSYGSTSNSFIFSLRNKEGLAPFKRMVARPQYAIYRYSSYGPTFGYGFDIYIADNANTNRHSHTAFGEYGTYTVPSGVKEAYTILAGAKNFSPDDWEVFYRQ